MSLPVAWSIAGFDPSAGAGISADLLVMAAHGVFGCSAITAHTVQNTLGVTGVEAVSPALLGRTLGTLWADLPPQGIKIGMLASTENVLAVAAFLAGQGESAPGLPVVVDPVLRSSSGRELLEPGGVRRLRRDLLPYAAVVTPNWPELAALAGLPVRDRDEAAAAARALQQVCPRLAVVATGGDAPDPLRSTDLLVLPGGACRVLEGDRVPTRSTHGTGCAFSSALLCRLMQGHGVEAAARLAKAYVEEALRQAPGLGLGRGPMGLLWPLGNGCLTSKPAC